MLLIRWGPVHSFLSPLMGGGILRAGLPGDRPGVAAVLVGQGSLLMRDQWSEVAVQICISYLSGQDHVVF